MLITLYLSVEDKPLENEPNRYDINTPLSLINIKLPKIQENKLEYEEERKNEMNFDRQFFLMRKEREKAESMCVFVCGGGRQRERDGSNDDTLPDRFAYH